MDEEPLEELGPPYYPMRSSRCAGRGPSQSHAEHSSTIRGHLENKHIYTRTIRAKYGAKPKPRLKPNLT